jgi:hypothetical protein
MIPDRISVEHVSDGGVRKIAAVPPVRSNRVSGIAMSAVAAHALLVSAPLQANQVGVIVSPPAPPPQAYTPPPYPYPYPLPSWVHPNSVRCEPDRLLTDKSPCGEEAPAPLPRCEMDRLLTDKTPCTRR